MNQVVKSLYLSFIIVAATVAMSAAHSGWSSSAQGEWTAVQRCLGLPTTAPSEPFPGMLVMVSDDAIRAFREGVPTTYVLSFAGGNFLRGAGVSPDGRYIAVPNGVITTVTNSDVRYTVQELRIVTTDTVPRIAVRVPWRASFPVGSLFTSAGDIPTVQWLDSENLLYVRGTLSEPQTWVTVDPFDANSDPQPAPLQGAVSWSPDGAHAIVNRDGDRVLFDVAASRVITVLPDGIDAVRAVWTRDSSELAVPVREDGRVSLAIFDAASGARSDIVQFEPYRSARSIRWSPDGTRLTYTLFDPETGTNRLHVVDTRKREVLDLCVELTIAGGDPETSAAVWSPNGNSLAIVTAQAVPNAVIAIVDLDENRRWTLIPASGELLGWYD